MTMEEARIKRDALRAEFEKLKHQIMERKALVQRWGVGYYEDQTLKRMQARSAQLISELTVLNRQIKEQVTASKDGPVEPLAEINVEAECYGMNAAQKRLVRLLAHEVGPARYEELRRRASGDAGPTAKPDASRDEAPKIRAEAVKPSSAKSETKASPPLPPRRLAWERTPLTEHEQFERMMRGNFNRYGGGNL